MRRTKILRGIGAKHSKISRAPRASPRERKEEKSEKKTQIPPPFQSVPASRRFFSKTAENLRNGRRKREILFRFRPIFAK
ncbi:MAG: hypothetical protein DBX55_09420 [Verrucomicrobia bacterium]|nr:MAG: hypothetical protein DBX55_09420 [Verrucomicrobiota bacterium]